MLSSLTPASVYHYRAKSKDASASLVNSIDYTFTTATAPTLRVTITANPSSGSIPLNGIGLLATVSGSITGNMNYTFYCDRSDSGTNITNPYSGKYNNQSATSYNTGALCNYANPGTYTAKVIIERGVYQAEARTQITVSQKNYLSIGSVDGADTNHVTGWAYDQNAGATPINVHVYIDGAPTANVVANLSRPDIIGAGNGVVTDANHGFDYFFSGLTPGTHTINIYAINTPTGTNSELSGSPKTITITAQTPTPTPTTTPTPTPIPIPTPTSTSTPTPTPTPTPNILNSSLLKSAGNPKVYVIANNQKKWIQTEQEFNQAGYSWSNVQEVSPSTLTSIPDYVASSLGSLLLNTADNKVYRIINNQKIWIPTIETFDKQGLSWSQVQPADPSQVDQYPRIKLIKAPGNEKVYYVTESGTKRHIPTIDIFNSYNDRWEDIVELSPADISSYPDNNLIKKEDDPKVYKLENGQKRWIQTASVFNRLKLDWTKITPVNQTEFNFYPTGSTIK